LQDGIQQCTETYAPHTLNGSGFQYFYKVICVSDMHNSEHVFYLSLEKCNTSS
jgi:hypothetical protein